MSHIHAPRRPLEPPVNQLYLPSRYALVHLGKGGKVGRCLIPCYDLFVCLLWHPASREERLQDTLLQIVCSHVWTAAQRLSSAGNKHQLHQLTPIRLDQTSKLTGDPDRTNHSLRGNSCRTKRNRDTEYWKYHVEEIVAQKWKVFIIYSLSCRSKPVWLTYCRTQTTCCFSQRNCIEWTLKQHKNILKVIHMAHEPHFLKTYDSFKWETYIGIIFIYW